MSFDMDPGTTGILTARYINLTDQENIRLVQEVEKHPILYNPMLPGYTRRSDTDTAWEQIGNVVNLPGPLCKERWKNMRVVFMRSLRQGLKRKKPYYLAKHMLFLLPYNSNLSEKLNASKQQEEASSSNAPGTIPPVTGDNCNSVRVKVESLPEGESPENSMTTDGDDSDNLNLSEENSVISFLNSLAPELQEMTFKQFKIFKRRVFTLVDDIKAND